MIQTAAFQCLGLDPGASAQFMGLEVALKNGKGKKKKRMPMTKGSTSLVPKYSEHNKQNTVCFYYLLFIHYYRTSEYCGKNEIFLTTLF